jgi:D-alanyl-D-alanine carboxypeptidase (penicillin-binding protein 5/6)
MLKKIPSYLLFLVVAASLSVQAAVIPAPPALSATGYILIDADSGQVLVDKNSHEQLPPASLTKMMTSYVLSAELAAGRVDKTDMVTISEAAWAQNPVFNGSSLMWIEVGKQVKLADLHRGVIISSGNDASVAVAEYLAGNEAEFANLMNKHAELLGMKDTQFKNSHGLPADDQYSSAYDLSLLAKAIIQNYPEDYAIYKEREFTYNQIRQPNRNRLLWRDPSVDGLKTGHTEEAGYGLVASAKKNDMRLISVVMGTKSSAARERDTQRLLAYGFRFYETHTLYAPGTELSSAKVWGGAEDVVKLGVSKSISLTIPRGRHQDIEAMMSIDSAVKAPVLKGAEYGELSITLDGEELYTAPLVAQAGIEEGGLFKRLWHGIWLFFQSFFG